MLLGEQGPVLFRPREWRGGSGSSWFERTAEEMAREINGYVPGSVAHLYVTSDGGANLDLVYEMVGLLEGHVEVVGPRTIVAMALARG